MDSLNVMKVKWAGIGEMRVALGVLLVILTPAIEGTDPGTKIITNEESGSQCAAKGLQGECNGCICCCYSGGGGLFKYTPDKCDCKKSLSQSQVLVTVTLSIIVAVPTILASCFFSGRCRVSPFKPERPVRALPRHQVVEMAPMAPTVGQGREPAQTQVAPPLQQPPSA
eukprot:jgi/Botrbrau1/14890/Bobra.0248s0009.1